VRRPREYRFYGVFDHPVRAGIINLLYTRGPVSFTELKKELSVSVGSLYYHISVLGELITQDEKKRYMLTDLGVATAKHLKTNPLREGGETEAMKLPLIERLAPFISGSLVIQGVNLSPLRHSVEAALILILGGWVTSLSGLEPRMLFLFKGASTSSTAAALSFFSGWLAIFTVSDLVSTVVFKSRRGHVSLLVSSTYSLIPIVLFTLLWLHREAYPLSMLEAYGWPFTILFFTLQVWSLIILSSAIRVSKRLTAGRSVLTVLLLVYLNIAFILFEGIP